MNSVALNAPFVDQLDRKLLHLGEEIIQKKERIIFLVLLMNFQKIELFGIKVSRKRLMKELLRMESLYQTI